jgi:Carboxypeptidase regulatory-like domain/TonB dependent receptor
MRFWRLFTIALVAVCTYTAEAQNTGPGRVIRGIVKDASGSSVPRASVVLLSPAGEQIAATSTAPDGTFRLSASKLSDGQLQIQRKGFKTYSLDLNPAKSLEPVVAVLELADVREEVNVSVSAEADQVSTDPAQNRDAAVLNDNMLEQLPVLDQDYIGAVSNFLDQGAGGNMGTTIVVDGMEQKDAGVTPSAVQNVKINNDPYSAEFSRPGRGRIEITTKTPDPVYHGTANVIFRDYNLDARNAFAKTRAPEQRRIFEGAFTGPVPRLSRTFFLLSGDYQQDNLQSIIFAQLPSGLLQSNVPSPVRAKDLSARLSHDFSERYSGALQFTYEGRARENQLTSGQQINAGQNPNGGTSNQNQAIGGYVLPEAGRNIASLERHLKYSDHLVISTTLLNQFQIMFERNRDSTASTTEQPQIVVQNAFVTGGAQATQLATENNVDIRDVLTWTHKKQIISAGFGMPNMSRRGLDDYSNRLGTYNFSSLQDFELQTPYSFSQQRGPVHFVYWQKELGGFLQDQIRVSSNLQVTLGMRWDWQNYLHDNNNFAPRASIAYALGKKRNTVLRAGGGVFYDRTTARPLGSLAEYSGPVVQNILVLNPLFPNPFPAATGPALQPPNLYRLSPGIRTPYLALYSASLEHQIFRSATLSATYRGMVGVGLFTSLNVNQPPPPMYLQRPNPSYGTYQELQSSGRQVGQALDISFSGKLGRYFSGIAQYTLSHTNNNTSGINYMPPNTYDVSGEYGRADFDQRQRFSMLASSMFNGWLNLGVGFTAGSGLPYTEITGLDLYNSGFANARPTGVGRNTLQGPGYGLGSPMVA